MKQPYTVITRITNDYTIEVYADSPEAAIVAAYNNEGECRGLCSAFIDGAAVKPEAWPVFFGHDRDIDEGLPLRTNSDKVEELLK